MARYRTGSRVPFNLYLGDESIGYARNEEIAAQLVADANAGLDAATTLAGLSSLRSARLKWLRNHPAETVALLVETGVLVQIPNLWWDSRPEPIGQHWYSNVTANRGPHRPEDSPGYRVSLPTKGDDQ